MVPEETTKDTPLFTLLIYHLSFYSEGNLELRITVSIAPTRGGGVREFITFQLLPMNFFTFIIYFLKSC